MATIVRVSTLAFVCINLWLLEAAEAFSYRTLTANPRDYLKVHNNMRKKIGLPPLQWDYKLATYARNYANKLASSSECEMVHSQGPYGENIFWGGGSEPWGAKFAVKSWSKEKKFYDYRTNSCKAGEMCGHYTQIVWKDTRRVGCARAVCKNGSGELVICSYDPAGNYIGEKPY